MEKYRADPGEDVEEDKPSLEHVVVENEKQANECAIFPAHASEEELLTSWVSAQGDAFVALPDKQ